MIALRTFSPARLAAFASAAVVLTSLGVFTPATAVVPAAHRNAPTCTAATEPAVGGRSLRAGDHENLSARDLRRMDRLLEQALARHRGAATGAQRRSVRRVPVRVHVIDGKRYRGPSKAEVRTQLNILNRAYSGEQSQASSEAGVSFVLKSFHRVRNQRWLTATVRPDGQPDADGREMRSRLHRGGAAALNLYFTTPGGDNGLLGYSSFPWDVNRDRDQDGVTIHSETLRGGAIGRYNSGDTAVHEAGHWLGLLHTFQTDGSGSGCSGRNDRVGDTAAEDRPSYKCPAGRDTCTADGLDPVHNFMDYSFDTCMNMFTAGQVVRMDKNWMAYRARR